MIIYNCLFLKIISVTTGTFFNIVNGWMEVPTPPKKFKKFNVVVEMRNYSPKSWYEALTHRKLGVLKDSVSYGL